ncbi:MAG: bifunctional methionine sulfoxide reductase B/A protein [Planctomycetota bacterium]
MRKLTPEEERVIVHKGTERPFTGEHTGNHAAGLYTCKRCATPLYRSGDKFDSECGWPSFDDEIPGAVKRAPDADGRRTEILCAQCGGHLGHVFAGEGFTPKDVRHCVNSISLDFAPQENVGRAIFASGCFWGTEYWLRRAAGVLTTTCGYTGGDREAPTYQEVCSGATGHAEAVEVLYDTRATDFRALCRLFFETHDPSQVDRQGPDVGEQYRSEIFVLDEEQRGIAEELAAALRAKGVRVATRITPAATFWPAEGYHQDYYEKKGATPYCHFWRKKF